ncbi:Hypothetical predicted protein [Marmota monax]|uniref:Uncharacterized protein n=1 Tax=Marmota monax TaxID=9995 RepID=A0A5E4C4W0_MARMO|nr:hypothetical protein GHT09_004538 [Marmota monax]VTJ76947.1 Hypothetical predicted protein [Marmota monax]
MNAKNILNLANALEKQIPGTSSVVQRKWKPLQQVSQPRGPGQPTKSRISAVAAEIKQIRARRKTARMLMENFGRNLKLHFLAVALELTIARRIVSPGEGQAQRAGSL